jgi:putative ABC transport system permease protein
MGWPFQRRGREDEIDEEIRVHLAIEIERRIERGETPVEAERAARREFGNIALVKEVTRGMWRSKWIDEIAQDVKYAARGMRRAPGFTLVAILILALGIGANTSIFSVINAAMLRPLPFPNANRLVTLYSTRNGVPIGSPSPLDVKDFAAASQCFESMVLYDHWRKNVSGISGSQAPEETVIGLVAESYFELLGVKPTVGRLFSKAENTFGRHYVAAISGTFWKKRFGNDPRVLGRTLRINGETYTIVAVMPDVIPGWMDRTSAPIPIWTPYASPDLLTEATRGDRGNSVLGRLKPGVSYRQAQSELDTLAGRLAQEHILDRGVGARLEPLTDTRAGPIRPVLLMLWGAVGMVLAIACANLASLLLARNSARSREMAVRAALGAGRSRLLRQMLLETLLLSLMGGVAGLALSAAAGAALARMNSANTLPYTTASNALGQFWSAAPEPRILLFTLCVSILTAALFGLAPAFSGARVSLSDTLREGGRAGTMGPSRQQFRSMLVIIEVALSVVLVSAASSMVGAMIRLGQADPGFPTDHLLLSHVFIPSTRYPDSAAISRFCEELVRRVRALPGVVDASVTTGYPPVVGWRQMFTIPGVPVPRIEDTPTARFANVDDHYLRTMAIPAIGGRDLAESDRASSPPVAVINEAFARRYFPDRNPIGREISPGPPHGVPAPSLQSFGLSTRAIKIVGVVRDFMNGGVALPPDPLIVTLFRQQPALNFGFKDLVVRTSVDPESIVPAVSHELKSLDEDIPLGEVRTMQEHMSNQTADTRFTTLLLELFAGLGTILAVIGVYGIVAYLVAQRTRDLAVRVALGATSADIVWLVLRHGLLLGSSGVAIGIAGALAVRQVFERYLLAAGASHFSPLAIVGTAVAVLLAIGLASAAPARRAVSADPVQALRAE